nr:MAG TPA: Protocadherin-15, LHFPL tetraspan subfamily member, LHFPL5, protocadherin, tip link [Caudoviricetes sp.]DAQ38649.1 MAG TPA: Protocadherin-15, LHFPL tetraspan subfamily member, LHFPL5, protocadherin, tip link [Caudoviricetes sp.]
MVLMAVAGVLFVVAVMTFLMVCCLLVNGGDD